MIDWNIILIVLLRASLIHGIIQALGSMAEDKKNGVQYNYFLAAFLGKFVVHAFFWPLFFAVYIITLVKKK